MHTVEITATKTEIRVADISPQNQPEGAAGFPPHPGHDYERRDQP
jgi:hypothetical protein